MFVGSDGGVLRDGDGDLAGGSLIRHVCPEPVNLRESVGILLGLPSHVYQPPPPPSDPLLVAWTGEGGRAAGVEKAFPGWKFILTLKNVFLFIFITFETRGWRHTKR